jgi:nanoRNase/pAp phosphatase (c-di-AMP/oligoRNAs hydrolase)
VVNASVFGGDVGAELLTRYPAAPFSAYYVDRRDSTRHWGLRSRAGEPWDVAAIAQRSGGGGHRHASGWREAR